MDKSKLATYMAAPLVVLGTDQITSLEPNILKYSLIPDEQLLSLWSDDSYKDRILKSPNLLFSDKKDYVVLDFFDNGVKNYVVPYLDISYEFETLEQILIQEIPSVSSEQLPADVLATALTDENFKKELIKKPKEILSRFGYNTDKYKIKILSDTAQIKHIILPKSPLNDSEFRHFKSQNQYLFGNECATCHNGYRPYDTRVYIECTSGKQCM